MNNIQSSSASNIQSLGFQRSGGEAVKADTIGAINKLRTWGKVKFLAGKTMMGTGIGGAIMAGLALTAKFAGVVAGIKIAALAAIALKIIGLAIVVGAVANPIIGPIILGGLLLTGAYLAIRGHYLSKRGASEAGEFVSEGLNQKRSEFTDQLRSKCDRLNLVKAQIVIVKDTPALQQEKLEIENDIKLIHTEISKIDSTIEEVNKTKMGSRMKRLGAIAVPFGVLIGAPLAVANFVYVGAATAAVGAIELHGGY